MDTPSPSRSSLSSLSSLSEPSLASQSRKLVGGWLLLCCGMVFVMVLLGGLTRLTHSGLSMVEWQPLTGVLPPMTPEEWHETFAKYQQFPEFQKINPGMTVEEFKGIFWLEFIHRLWGRGIGLVFFLPFLFFWLSGRLEPGLPRRLLGIFALGGLQGGLGWYMVKSGLVDHPDVSPYRLTAHLALAFILYAGMLALALGLLRPPSRLRRLTPSLLLQDSRLTALRAGLSGLLLLTSLTILMGGFVAGLDAGLIYNTFPLMDGALIPSGLFPETPGFRSLFEDVKTAQFMHRTLAELTLGVGLGVGWLAHRASEGVGLAPVYTALLLALLMQVGLGIATLVLVVPVTIAALHQAGALVLFSFALWGLHESRR